MFVAIAVAILTLLILLKILISSSWNSKAPPGPWGFPILGHLPLMGDNPGKAFLDWKAIYGPIFSVRFGSFNTIVFNDIKTVKEAFGNPAFNGRKNLSYFAEATNRKGIIFAEGPPTIEQRRFIMKAMKDFGFRSGGSELEKTVQTEISELLNSFKVNSGQPMRLYQAFNLSTVNAIWLCLTGKRFELGDPNLKKLAEICSKILDLPTGFQSLAYFIPLLSKLFPNLSGYNAGLEGYKSLINFIDTHISDVEKSRIKNQPRNLADAYMDKVDGTTDESSSFYHSKKFQSVTFSDLFLGGIETTSTLLEWTLAYLAVYPQVQKKLQKEIFEVTGNTRLPCLADRPSMPYTDAVIYEVIRRAPLVGINLARQTLEDTVFHGYTLPKGTMIYANYYGLCVDQEVWGDPENFRPERFISTGEGGKFKKPDELLPFGWGKRNCVGENLARDQSFLYVASLFQVFNVSLVPGKEVSLKVKFGSVIHPDVSNEVILTERI